MRRKGFTLIELIVVMAIVGVLVMLAMPRYLKYRKEAKLVQIKVQAKELEKVCEKYYMTFNEWPRLSDTPYSAEQLKDYTERIYSSIGEEIELEEEGNYYDIDYSLITRYIKEPSDKENYILQNPVGKVYYLDNQKNKEELLLSIGKVSNTLDGFVFDMETGTVQDYIGGKKLVIIPEKFNVEGVEYEVKAIAPEAFVRKGLESVVIPKTVETIASRSFRKNSNLVRILVDKENPYFISINNAIYTKDKTELIVGTKVMSGNIEDTVTLIRGHAFNGMGVTNVKIPKNVVKIVDYAFEDNDIKDLYIPKNVTELGLGFTINPFLTKVEVDKDNIAYKSVNNAIYTKDGSMIILGTKGMAENIEPTTTRIRRGTFYGMGLTSVKIPSSVTTIDIGSFHLNPDLVKVEVESTNPNYKSINNAIYSKDGKMLLVGTKVMSANIENSTERIREYAFFGMGINSVKLPVGLDKIDAGAFGQNSLTSVVIPYNVSSIGGSSFSNNNLTQGSVVVKNPSTVIAETSFSSNGKNKTETILPIYR